MYTSAPGDAFHGMNLAQWLPVPPAGGRAGDGCVQASTEFTSSHLDTVLVPQCLFSHGDLDTGRIGLLCHSCSHSGLNIFRDWRNSEHRDMLVVAGGGEGAV